MKKLCCLITILMLQPVVALADNATDASTANQASNAPTQQKVSNTKATANPTPGPAPQDTVKEHLPKKFKHFDVIDKRIAYENGLKDNPFLILPYMPNYVLPFNYTSYPDYTVYNNNTPNDQRVDHVDLKFQFSFKVPVWRNVFNRPSNLYFAYTQQSYWQAYADSAYFRETNYQPEVFLANYFNKPLSLGWRLKFVNAGLVHQSNGRGGDMERTWNRAYGEMILANKDWAMWLKPWYVIRDASMREHNPDITHYLGYGYEQVSYKYHQQTFSLGVQNVVESTFQRGAETFTWSFPLTTHLKGYVDLFSGFGQSLIEYNHYTNAVGVGIALNDWV